MIKLHLQGVPEALHGGGVVAAGPAAHAGDHAVVAERPEVISRDHGRSWSYASTVAVPPHETEGFNESVLVQVTTGARAGRLICLLRTGRELCQSHSDNAATWSEPRPILAGIDVESTAVAERLFPDAAAKADRLLRRRQPQGRHGLLSRCSRPARSR